MMMRKSCRFCAWKWPFQPISQSLPKRVGWPCSVRPALKRTPVQNLNSFSIMFYYIISTTYQKIWDLFCPVHIFGLSHSVSTLGFFCNTVHRGVFCKFPFRWIYYYGSNKSTEKETDKTHLCAVYSLLTMHSSQCTMLCWINFCPVQSHTAIDKKLMLRPFTGPKLRWPGPKSFELEKTFS